MILSDEVLFVSPETSFVQAFGTLKSPAGDPVAPPPPPAPLELLELLWPPDPELDELAPPVPLELDDAALPLPPAFDLSV